MAVGWLTTQIDVGPNTYKATEPSTADVEAMMAGASGGAFTAAVRFVHSCIVRNHPNVTEDEIKKGMPPRLLKDAAAKLMDLATVQPVKPGEAPRA